MTARDENTRAVLTLRMPEVLRARLEAKAKQSGWTMTNEIIRRLEMSLIEEERAGGAHTAALVRMISAAIQLVETQTGKEWIRDGATLDACAIAVARCLETYKTPAEGTPAELAAYIPFIRLREDAAAILGRIAVDAYNNEIRSALSLMRQADEAARAGKPAGRLKTAAALAGFPVQDLERDRAKQSPPEESGGPSEEEILQAILELAAKIAPDARPNDPDWRERIAKVAYHYPGGPIAMFNALVRQAQEASRAMEDREPGPTLADWMADQKTKQTQKEGSE